MLISPINFNNISFKSTTRTTYKGSTGEVFVLPTYRRGSAYSSLKTKIKITSSNSTSFFRKDLNWQTIGKTFKKQFPKEKVNVYDFACSDGSEAYSLVIALIEQLGEKQAKRFFPIKASDIDPQIINMAKSGTIQATQDDILAIESMIKKGGIKKYFKVTELGGERYLLTPKEMLSTNVIFEQSSVSQALDEVQKDENNIILARNFWKYLSQDEITDASWKIAQNLNKKALIIIGNFDSNRTKETPFFLKALGYEPKKGDSNKNILYFDNNYINLVASRNLGNWSSFVASNFKHYIPSYIA